ncbi:MAG: adenylate/guanylate cyclase domain-containing protein [Chloroflexia bacterium]|nr:adenylate/guanylate cyclase domain-containing protein [Chloroflexia bacterium]
MRKLLDWIRGLFIRIPPRYAQEFVDTIMSENLGRIVVGGMAIALIEVGVFLTGTTFHSAAYYYPISIVLFNLLVTPLLIILGRRPGGIRHKRAVVYLVVAVYVLWSCFYTWAARTNQPLSAVNLPLYMLMVYGAAVLIYMEPLWSALLFSTSMAVFILLSPFNLYDRYTFLGNIWNVLALSLFAWITTRLLFAFRLRTFVAQRELEEARAKSDALLLNILPAKIVTELKETGTTSPERFEKVTVFFSDIVDFTQISSRLSPEVLIRELNELFTAFDTIIERFECERIKTIGDAFLCVCGMPQAHPHYAAQILEAALEIVDYLRERNATHPHQWQIRIGVHSGSVIGGVVGTKKYIYDVFGDTINIAARMEEHSAPMQINVSESTYELTRDRFRFVERGPIPVKGKGEMRMYFLLGPASHR